MAIASAGAFDFNGMTVPSNSKTEANMKPAPTIFSEARAALGRPTNPTYPRTKGNRTAAASAPDAITVAEAAFRFCVSTRTVRRMIAHNRLRVVRIGSAVRIPIAEIVRVLAPHDLDFAKVD